MQAEKIVVLSYARSIALNTSVSVKVFPQLSQWIGLNLERLNLSELIRAEDDENKATRAELHKRFANLQ